ncbi:similar to Saccharomyces cerevisiae YBR255C-A Putative protein of unknown function [Geotrichum candidum]|uniref:Cytochrome c oxidase assembly protein COX20, mitochondrial n=1 Tax=Geotrichum candidum TaxID=1173061 RepID=A0A0J9XIX6_GEOCN|nr:similar to Saccharomyces cerevisiae YBR255C-A Putative protein of unknown function [Geotrichum candidum]
MRPSHHEPAKLKGAIQEIINGCIYGGAIGLASAAAFHFASMRFLPRYRQLTIQFRTFIAVGIVFTPACWHIDQNLLRYEREMVAFERREKIRKMEEDISNGQYVDLYK